METLRKEGLPVDENLEKKANELEEEIIKEEILPALKENIEPLLSEIQREIVLVVEHRPGEPISVALSRKVRISDLTDVKSLTPLSKPVSSAKPSPKPEPHAPTKKVENPTKGLRVTFPDDTIVWHQSAIKTFIEVLRKIGLERIPQVGIMHSGYNLVGKVKRPPKDGVVWQHEVAGWYVYSNVSNEKKADDLRQIAKFFNLSLKIEEGKANP